MEWESLRRVGLSALEYLLVAGMMAVGARYARMIRHQLRKNGALAGIGFVIMGVFFFALGFAVLSVCIRPGLPLYLLSSNKGRGACVAILCSVVYGFFRRKRDPARPSFQHS